MKNLICLLIVLVTFSFPNAILGQTVATNNASVDAELHKYKPNTELEIELKSGITVKGKLSAINKDNFEIKVSKNSMMSIPFTDVKRVKKIKHNLFLSTLNRAGQTILFVPGLIFYLVLCSTSDCA